VTSHDDDDAALEQLQQYAFHMEPQITANGGVWTAFYPGADWSVSGSTKSEALNRLGDEFARRQNDGDDPLAYADRIYLEHLREPIDGIYAVDNELYRQLIHAPAEERERVVREAERRRRLGQTYTPADYRRDSAG
jgi:hypothetical protein